jgi:hypothetical protein
VWEWEWSHKYLILALESKKKLSELGECHKFSNFTSAKVRTLSSRWAEEGRTCVVI